jgi:hypothetical protein
VDAATTALNTHAAGRLNCWQAAVPKDALRGIMRAHGFSIDFVVELVRVGLATATSERVVTRPNTIEVARLRITNEGRRVLRA